MKKTRVFGITGSHRIGKTTTFDFLKRDIELRGGISNTERPVFIGEFADCILRQMGLREDWEEFAKSKLPYKLFEQALDLLWFSAIIHYEGRIVITDRTPVDHQAYKKRAGLSVIDNLKSIFTLHNVKVFTFLLRAPWEDKEVAEDILHYLEENDLEYEQIHLYQGVNFMEIAREIEEKIKNKISEREE